MNRLRMIPTQLSCGRCGEGVTDDEPYTKCCCWGCWDVFCDECMTLLETRAALHQAQLALGMADRVYCLHSVFRVLAEIENGEVFEG